MEIEIVRVPHYSSKRVNVILVDGKPLCTCRGQKTTSLVVSALSGYDVNIQDGAIKKAIERVINNASIS